MFVDLDTTVTPALPGTQERRCQAPTPATTVVRESYHPILARIAQTGTFIGKGFACGSGDRGLGELDVEDVEQWLDRTRAAAGPAAPHHDAHRRRRRLRAAAAGHRRKGRWWFLVKMKQTPNLVGAVWATQRWITVDRDAFGKAHSTGRRDRLRARGAGHPCAVARLRDAHINERLSGAQAGLWDDLDYSVHVYATNDTVHNADELARRYDERAGIEPVFAGASRAGFGIGKVSTECFDANEAAFLLKVLAFNLLRRWVQARHPTFAPWRTLWIRRVCVQIPGRLLRSGGRWELRLAPRPMLN